MTFQAGVSGNPVGRRKGSVNRDSRMLAKALEGEGIVLAKEFAEQYKKLQSPEEKMQALKWITPHVAPSIGHNEIEIPTALRLFKSVCEREDAEKRS